MRKIVLVYGSIIGVILCINIFFMVNMMYNNPTVKSNDFLGYAMMILLFSLIFFGIRNYRNKFLDGNVNFGKAFKVGALISLVASVIYVVVWLFYYYLFVPDFMDVYTSYVLQHCDPAELDAKTVEMKDFSEMYKNPLFVILITLAEVLPIGLIVALISALILKKRKKQLTTN